MMKYLPNFLLQPWLVFKQAVDSARKMKSKGYASLDISEITGLTVEEIEAL